MAWMFIFKAAVVAALGGRYDSEAESIPDQFQLMREGSLRAYIDFNDADGDTR